MLPHKVHEKLKKKKQTSTCYFEQNAPPPPPSNFFKNVQPLTIRAEKPVELNCESILFTSVKANRKNFFLQKCLYHFLFSAQNIKYFHSIIMCITAKHIQLSYHTYMHNMMSRHTQTH